MKILIDTSARATVKGKNCPHMAISVDTRLINSPVFHRHIIIYLILNNIFFRTVDIPWKSLSCKSQRRMTGFTDFISDKKKGGIKEQIQGYLHFLAQWSRWIKCISKAKKNLHTPIFIETKQKTTDLTYLSQFPTKLNFWNVKTWSGKWQDFTV